VARRDRSPPPTTLVGVTIAPERAREVSREERHEADRPWVTIVWNDPINLMSYVTYVLQKLFGYSREKATKLMLDVHQKGRAVVSSGAKETMEFDVARLHAAGLWATLQQD
jgi:ATP-dependent Clp protease adaptor protein ClpS